jgi:acetoacetyl-CoA synthetase
LQGLGLAMAVKVFDREGVSIEKHKGELVCTAAFPSMPIYFWNDPDNRKYHKAYFEKYYSIWTHGDYAEITQHSTQAGIQQGLIIYGRSDSTLNPGGVRIGTAEIYRQVELIDFISDGIVVAQSWNNDQRIILFVQLKNEQLLTESMIEDIKTTIRQNSSPHHVPEKIIQIHDIPRTYNGKLAELAVCDVIHDRPVTNISALINPDSLKEYEHMGQLQ